MVVEALQALIWMVLGLCFMFSVRNWLEMIAQVIIEIKSTGKSS